MRQLAVGLYLIHLLNMYLTGSEMAYFFLLSFFRGTIFSTKESLMPNRCQIDYNNKKRFRSDLLNLTVKTELSINMNVNLGLNSAEKEIFSHFQLHLFPVNVVTCKYLYKYKKI